MATSSSQIIRCFSTVLVVCWLILDAPSKVSGQSALCPRECWCLGSLVDCSKRQLRSVPTALPTWVTMLELQSNRISSIPDGTFDGLLHLEQLDLSYNKLRRLNSTVFSGLTRLQQLKLASNKLTSLPVLGQSARNLTQLILHHNRITSISPAALRGLTSLHMLDLSYNRIGQFRAGTFPPDNRLHLLYLENNRISSLQERSLDYLRSLEVLKLNRNRIASLPRDLFTHLESLRLLPEMAIFGLAPGVRGMAEREKLRMSQNVCYTQPSPGSVLQSDAANIAEMTRRKAGSGDGRVEAEEEGEGEGGAHPESELLFWRHPARAVGSPCDCQISWFPTWLQAQNLEAGVDGRCDHPAVLHGANIFSVAAEEFTCDDRLKPFIIREPDVVTSLRGDNVSLICTAGSTSDTPVKFVWKKDRTILEAANTIYYERLNPNRVNEYTSVLSLPHIREEEEGRYQCIISNEFGSTYSKKAKVTVHIFPSFTSTPININVQVGGVANLPCAAVGHPTPKIAWQKDGGINFPAARQRRFKLNEKLERFYIDDVQMIDTGVYTCTAHNAAGTISTNASLTVLEQPFFTRQMKDLSVTVGEPAVLECNAEGSPRPNIRWFKDGVAFVPGEGTHLTDFDRYLIIMNAESADSGSYVCEASNMLGIQTDGAKLTVRKNTQTIWNMTTTTIIIVVVICCVVGTSLIWVVIIYQTRRRPKRFRVAETHVVPAEIPSSTLNGSSEGTIHQETSSGVSSAATDKYQGDNVSDCDSLDGPLGKLSTFKFPSRVRMAAIFPSETQMQDPPELDMCGPKHRCSMTDNTHRSSLDRYCLTDSVSEADHNTLERRGQLIAPPCCGLAGRSLDSAINKHPYLHHGVGGRGGRMTHPDRARSDGEDAEIEEEEEDDEDVFQDEATRDRLQRERLLTNSDEGLGSQTASPVNRQNHHRHHPSPQCCHSYTSVLSPNGRCTSPSSFKIPHEHEQSRDLCPAMTMSSSSLPCNGRIPTMHLYENPTTGVHNQDRDLISGHHLCRSHNHVNSASNVSGGGVNINNNSNNNHCHVAPASPTVRQSHSIPSAIASTGGDMSPGIVAPLSPTAHLSPTLGGHQHLHHFPHRNQPPQQQLQQHHCNGKYPRQNQRHPRHERHRSEKKGGQSIPRTSYLPASKAHPAHASNRVTSPTLTSPAEV
ncbi:uncharacterized protein [Diadema setosum]|uniref:uncharacterized protein n=1 Tax=Diadema setosum TaxID=31175 RepID=UPI003B3AD683